MNTINQLFDTSSVDIDESRRRTLFNILSIGVVIATIVGLLLAVFANIANLDPNLPYLLLYLTGISLIISIVILWVINRYWSSRIAGSVFVLLLILSLTLSSAPQEVTSGRALFMFTIPILIAGSIVHPSAGFLAAAIVSIIINYLIIIDPNLSSPNFLSPLGFFLIALIAWLWSRSLERTLVDLQLSNKQLEQKSAELETTNLRLREENLERRRAETELAQQAEVLKRTNAELQQFAYISTHDLREPLRNVRVYAELLESRYQGALDDKADKYIQFIVRGATRMQLLITDLLAYLSVGDVNASFRETDMNRLVGQAIEDLATLIKENSAVITHDLLPTLQVDPGQMTHLFQNLLSNAIKFRRAEPPCVHIGAEQQSDHWLFSVADNGIGLDTAYDDRVFVIFQRLHTKEKYDGTGMGLAISKKVVENHSGRIWFTSNPDEGTTFFFTIPVLNFAQKQ